MQTVVQVIGRNKKDVSLNCLMLHYGLIDNDTKGIAIQHDYDQDQIPSSYNTLGAELSCAELRLPFEEIFWLDVTRLKAAARLLAEP